MAAVTSTDVVAIQLEKVRKKLPRLYAVQGTLHAKIQKRDVEKVSTRTMRIPLQVAPGGAVGYVSFDGGDLGRGSATALDYGQITPVGLRFAVEITKLVEWVTNSPEKATMDYTKTEVARAMKQFRRDIDTQLQTAGNAVSGTVSSVAGTVITLNSTPFGARLLRQNQKVQVYNSALTVNRGSMTILAIAQNLSPTQTITVDAVPAGTTGTDVIVWDGLVGASPVGIYGLPYYHNSSSTGTCMGISRGNNYIQADLVAANSSALALPQIRLAVDKIHQNIGDDQFDSLKSLVWYGHRAQRAAYEEIAASMMTMEKKSDGKQQFDLIFGDGKIGGIDTIWNINADPTRLDLLNLETWGRAEWKEIDFFENKGQTVFQVYGASGGVAASYLFYLVTGVQYFVDNPRAVGGITGLSVPLNYA
jgi:hypothetical protein